MERIAWVLNLDAEDELARPRGYRTPGRLLPVIENAATRLRGLIAASDVVLPVRALAPASRAAGCVGRAWCPTPSALARLRAEGASPESAPPLVVLARSNDRGTYLDLDPLPGARFARTSEEVVAALTAASPGSRWILRRGLSAAGRGRRPVTAHRLEDSDLAFIRAALERGGVAVEPRVDVDLELALHGWIRHGQFELGRPCIQTVAPGGAWQATRRTLDGEVETRWLVRLEEAAVAVAERLIGLGYFGPFGVDAFVWRDAAGCMRMHAPSDVNARYSMGWAVGTAAG